MTYENMNGDQRLRAALLTKDQRQEIVSFFMNHGDHLASKEEWSMDDNFNCTEDLAALHMRFFPNFEEEDNDG